MTTADYKKAHKDLSDFVFEAHCFKIGRHDLYLKFNALIEKAQNGKGMFETISIAAQIVSVSIELHKANKQKFPKGSI